MPQPHHIRLIARKLREARTTAGISQSDLAAQLQISQQAFSKYETSEAEIPFRTLVRVCALLPIAIEEFLPLYSQGEQNSSACC